MTQILLVGTELPLLEGLAQTFATLGFQTLVTRSLGEARDAACQQQPLVSVVSRTLAAGSGAEMLSIPLAPGGALILYSTIGTSPETFSPSVRRAVLAELALPLERNRLMALVQRVASRAQATGRAPASTPPERVVSR